ncbi:MAG: thioredoxin [Chloroflexi bacterium]|nr:thioredoxin [Chloroflexota bacterium]
MAIEISDQSFGIDVLEAGQPVLVDFWAPWCGPCRMVAPIVEELSREYEGKVGFAKMNVDDNPNVPGQFGIRSIPTLIVFKGGREVSRIVGFRPKGELKRHLDAALAS